MMSSIPIAGIELEINIWTKKQALCWTCFLSYVDVIIIRFFRILFR